MQVINCIKKDNPLIKKKLKEVTVEEGMAIATELFQILNKRGDGIGSVSYTHLTLPTTPYV